MNALEISVRAVTSSLAHSLRRGRGPAAYCFAFALLFAVSGALASAASAPKKSGARTLTLAGLLTNTTADASGNARLTLAIEGNNVTATLKTEPPLIGSGKLEGTFRNGWLELSGKLDEGFTLQFRGALNARDYRGTYIAAVPGTPVQYGKFQLVLEH